MNILIVNPAVNIQHVGKLIAHLHEVFRKETLGILHNEVNALL